MGEFVGSSDKFSTWGKFRAPFTNPENYYGMVLTAQWPSWVGSDHSKEFRAGRLVAGDYTYPPAYFISEHGSMFKVIPYSSFGWAGAYLSWAPILYETTLGYFWYYGDDVKLFVSMDQRAKEQMIGTAWTWDYDGGDMILDETAFTTGQDYGWYQAGQDGTYLGSGFVAIEKLKELT
jgi:hypothetical protein